MEKRIIAVFVFFILISIIPSTFAAQINSTNYKQNVVVSTGGGTISSSSYKNSVAVGILNSVVTSASYINSIGFFHTILLADGQSCASASQCEGGFCCSNLCASSACPGGGVGGGGGGAAAAAAGGGGSNITVEAVKNFSVSTGSIKEEISLGESRTRNFTIKNTGNVPLSFNIDILNIEDFVSVSESSFTLEPGQEKVLEATITGKKLGSYTGEIDIAGGEIKKYIDMIIDVSSQQVLFDVKLDIPTAYKEVVAGSILKAQITLLNIGPARHVDATMTYIIKDKQGNVIHESSEALSVEKQTSFIKSFEIPKDSRSGDYIIVVEMRYEKLFAVSSELFRVVPKNVPISHATSGIAMISALAVLAILMLLVTYLVMPNIMVIRQRKVQMCYKILDEAKEAVIANNVPKATLKYMEARKLYSTLKKEDKKNVYSEMMEIYTRLK